MFASDYTSHKDNSDGDDDDDSDYLPVIIAASCACVLLLVIAIILMVIIVRVKRRGKDSKFLSTHPLWSVMHTNINTLVLSFKCTILV